MCYTSIGRMIQCSSCQASVHPACLGLSKHAYPAGTFTCANCVQEDAKIYGINEALTDATHRLVWLKGMRVQESSQHTYASGLHRYVKFGLSVCGKQPRDMLPPGEGVPIDMSTLHLFISWAAAKYKYNTIQSTISALIDWHKSKDADYSAISCKATKELLATVKATQGPAGLPLGKQGLTKEILRLLLCYLRNQGRDNPAMAGIYLRDECGILLGYYGMLRRSEIAALTLSDIRVGQLHGTKYIEVHIARSKTDRARVGATVIIAGRTQDNIDIAGPLERFIHERAGSDPGSPLFTQWDLDAMTSHPTRGLSKQGFSRRLQQHLRALKAKYPGININPDSYGMHSLRRGGVMAAWKAGVDVEKIKAHGRWRSDAVRAYMQATRDIKLVVTNTM